MTSADTAVLLAFAFLVLRVGVATYLDYDSIGRRRTEEKLANALARKED